MAREHPPPIGGYVPPAPSLLEILSAKHKGKRISRWNCGWCAGSGYGGEKQPDCDGCEGRGWHEALLEEKEPK